MIAKSDLNKAGVPAENSILSVPKNATILINTKSYISYLFSYKRHHIEYLRSKANKSM